MEIVLKFDETTTVNESTTFSLTTNNPDQSPCAIIALLDSNPTRQLLTSFFILHTQFEAFSKILITKGGTILAFFDYFYFPKFK